jgi:hypothetical protein
LRSSFFALSRSDGSIAYFSFVQMLLMSRIYLT